MNRTGWVRCSACDFQSPTLGGVRIHATLKHVRPSRLQTEAARLKNLEARLDALETLLSNFFTANAGSFRGSQNAVNGYLDMIVAARSSYD